MRNDLPQYRVELYPKASATGTWSSTYIEITDMVDMSSSAGIETNNDTFSINLKNVPAKTSRFLRHYRKYSDGSNFFNLDDRVRILAWYGTEPSDFDKKFVFDGVIREWEFDDDTGGSRFILRGANVAEELLRVIIPSSYLASDTYHTSPDIIQNLLARMNSMNKVGVGSYRYVVWDPANPTSGFATIGYGSDYRPVYDQIAELSLDKFTGNGDYQYYIRTDTNGVNYLVWNKKTSNVGVYDSIIEGYDYQKIKLQRGVFDAFNAAIVMCGRDPEGVGVYTWAIDTVSAGQIGTRWKYLVYKKAEEIYAAERLNNPTKFTEGQKYPVTYTPSYVSYFTAAKSDTNSTPYFTKDSTVTITSNAEFRSAIRKQAKFTSKDLALGELSLHGKAQYKSTADLVQGNLKYTKGKLLRLIIPSMGFTQSPDRTVLCRVQNVNHSIGKNGWQTSLELLEDWNTAKGY